ncbi:MAG TPA: glycosyltransferase [Candidatus Acidoferrum sp.]|nr:glycosyltransferase [Candidatus Acidoferrum sp.]
MLILCLCREIHNWKLLPSYADAFRLRGWDFHYLDADYAFDAPLSELIARCPAVPDLIMHFDSGLPLLPEGLVHSPIPTMRYDVDTHTYLNRRMRWAGLFDLVSVCHAGYEKIFQEHGHPGAFLLGHAARPDFFSDRTDRACELGWVGTLDGPFYGRRRAMIPRLAATFHMNDWRRAYALKEVAEIYSSSKIVVNISRDDFPEDANMRVFEVQASGALLITSLPTQLTAFGYQEGVHFVGYREEAEVIPLVQRLLADDELRMRIADAGREFTRRCHTYDSRVATILDQLARVGSRMPAPARQWSESRVRFAYLDFFSGYALPRCAWSQYRAIVGHGARETMQGVALLAKAWARNLRQTGRIVP